MNKPMLLGVVGKPVLHSKSPEMHNAALAEAGIQGRYIRIAAESVNEALECASEIGISGLNVTAPFKEEAAKIVDEMSPEAEESSAVNTILIRNGKTKGFNTDPEGVRSALERNGVPVKGKKIVVLGAGGAGKAAVLGLRAAGAEVLIANRTLEKAQEIGKRSGVGSCRLGSREFESGIKNAEVVVSTLSTTERAVEPGLLHSGLAILDAVYGKETALATDAKKRGCRVISGIEWLVYQGAASFERFTGKKPSLEVMRKAIGVKGKTRKRNLSLIGFMGSGKSAVGAELSKTLGMGFVDMDEEIEKKAGKSIERIFESEGEAEFRKMESGEVERIQSLNGKVISCGGGVVLNTENVRKLKECSKIIWIYANPKSIVERVGNDSTRPLLNVKNKKERVEKLLSSRIGLYAGSCDLFLCTDGKKVADVAGRIRYEIGEQS